MPLRQNPTAWFNLPGVVAAFQPSKSPNEKLARYNQANGGSNRYFMYQNTAWPYDFTVAPITQPYGWNVSSAKHVFGPYGLIGSTGQDKSVIVVHYAINARSMVFGQLSTYPGRFYINGWVYATSDFARAYMSGGVGASLFPGWSLLKWYVSAIAGASGYKDGELDATWGSGTTTAGALYINPYPGGQPFYGYVKALAYYDRVLSAAEVRDASRQMAYCDQNPDWSAWGRRRKWYYMPSAAGAVRISPSTGLAAGGSPRIVPVKGRIGL